MPTDFEVMAHIARSDGQIASSPLQNIIELKKTKQGWQVTIGLDNKWGQRLFVDHENVVGSLYLIDKTEFFDAKNTLKEKEDKS